MGPQRPAIIEDNIFIKETVVHPYPSHLQTRPDGKPSCELSAKPSLMLRAGAGLKASLLASLTHLSYLLHHSKSLEMLPVNSLYAEWLQGFTVAMKEAFASHAKVTQDSRGTVFSRFFERTHRVGALSGPAYPFEGNVDDLLTLITVIARLEENRNRIDRKNCCLDLYYLAHRSLGPPTSPAATKLAHLGRVLCCLSLVHCQLSDAHFSLLAKHMKHVRRLDISDNEITNEGLASLLRPYRYASSSATADSAFYWLEFLSLAGNAQVFCRKECLGLFELLPSLVEIDISETGLATLPIAASLQGMHLLRRVDHDTLQALVLHSHGQRSLEYQIAWESQSQAWGADASLGCLSYASLFHPLNYLLDMYVWHQYSTIAVNDLALPTTSTAASRSRRDGLILRVSAGELKSKLREEEVIQQKANASKAGSWVRQSETRREALHEAHEHREKGDIDTSSGSAEKTSKHELDTCWLADFQTRMPRALAVLPSPQPELRLAKQEPSSSMQFPLALVNLGAMAATSSAPGSVGSTPIASVATVRSLESQLALALKRPASEPRLSMPPKAKVSLVSIEGDRSPHRKKQCTLSSFFPSKQKP